jgi:multiple sugar transport system permease protein
VRFVNTLSELRKSRESYYFLAPSVIIFLVFGLSVLVANVVLSFYSWSALTEPRFIGLDNYRRLFHDAVFRKALVNTLYYCALYVVPSLIISVLLAFVLNKKLKGMNLFRSIFYLPVITSYVIVVILWQWIYDADIGLLNSILNKIGIASVPWLLSPKLALPSLVLMSIWKNVGYTIVIFLAGFQQIDVALHEAARVEGATEWQVFRHITLPLLRPTTLFSTVMLIIWSFQMFVQPYMMTHGGPARSTTTLVYYLYETGFQYFDLGYASTMSVVMLIMVLPIIILQSKLLRAR